jgi:nucleotide-binding universal stress UspA family protein
MKLEDLVVVLDGSSRADVVTGLAIDIARHHDAHLTGLCPLDLLLPTDLLLLSGYPEASPLQEAASQMQVRAEEKAHGIGASFLERLRLNNVRGNWQLAGGPAAHAVTRRARTADLLVIGQNDPDHPLPPPGRHLVGDALMNCARPLLVTPYAGRFETIGTNVLIGWNGTREAARAVHDALLLLDPATNVTVLTVEHAGSASETQEVPGAEIAEHLARHGLKVTAARTVIDASMSDADALLGYVSDSGADLLVVGGYGHSRAREMVLGGVTRELLNYMTVPLLMSH